MRLKKINIDNIYSFKSATTLTFENDYSIFIGPNNVGKSNIFRIVNLFLKELTTPGANFEEPLQFSTIGTPNITFEITLSHKESYDLTMFLHYFISYNTVGYTRSSFGNKKLPYLLDDIKISMVWDSMIFPQKGLSGTISILFHKINVLLKYTNGSWTADVNGSAYQFSIDFLNCIMRYVTQKKFVSEIKKMTQNRTDSGADLSIGIPSISKGFQRYALSNIQKYFGPDQNISILKFFARLIGNSLFVTGNKRNISTEEPLGLPNQLKSDGSNITRFLYALSTSPIAKERDRFKNIQSKFKDIFVGNKEFEIVTNYSLDSENARSSEEKRELKSLSLVFVENESKKQFYMDQVHTGVHEVLFFLTALIGLENCVILMDEPGINLHLLLMKRLIKEMLKDSELTGNQFIIISHSSQLVHQMFLEAHTAVYYFSKDNNNATKINSWDPKPQHNIQILKGKLSYTLNPELFFANIVIIVEGETEKIVFSMAAEYFSKSNTRLDLESNGILIIDARSISNFPLYKKIFDYFKIRFALIADNNVIKQNHKLKNIFKNPTRINGNGIVGKSKKYFMIDNIGKGDIEDLLKSISPSDYKAAEISVKKVYPKGNKPMFAQTFMENAIKNKISSLRVLQDVLIAIAK